MPKVFLGLADTSAEGGNMTADQLLPAAQFLRMSTEHQQYSVQNQSVAIRQYAELHGFGLGSDRDKYCPRGCVRRQ